MCSKGLRSQGRKTQLKKKPRPGSDIVAYLEKLMNMDRLPHSALTLYVKLYCKRKGSSSSKYHNNLVEATKSWLSLSKNEKQQFIDKYKEFQIEYRKLFANYLKNAKPYLKRKNHIRIETAHEAKNYETDDEQIKPELQSQEINNFHSTIDLKADKDDNNSDYSMDAAEIATESLDNQQTTDEPQEYLQCELPEPKPPSMITSKNLFEIMKSMDETTDSTWESLSKAEKLRYQFALRSIKKEYINKYKAYLESLSSKKLFDHYNKML